MTNSVTSSTLAPGSFGAQGRNVSGAGMGSLLTPRAAMSATDGMVYNDLRALTDLKTQSREDPKAALHEVAKQFESLFVNMMMKAMRDTLPKDGLFGGSDVQTYQEMYDQQLALDFGKNGSLGLAKVIERQLSSVIAPVETTAVMGEMPLNMNALTGKGN